MNIYFRHGPKDGETKFLPLGKVSDTIIFEGKNSDYLYKRTSRLTNDGYVVYQCLGVLSELTAA